MPSRGHQGSAKCQLLLVTVSSGFCFRGKQWNPPPIRRMDTSNQRKRQLVDSYKKSEGSKKMMSVEQDRTEDFDKGDAPSPSSATPILSSIIATPPSPPTAASKNSTARTPTTPPINYLTLFTAFRQFLNGYVQAGGDANYANALATCASALPMPPNPMKPMISLSPHNSLAPPTPMISEDSKAPATPPSIKTEEPEAENRTAPDAPTTLSDALGEEDGDAKKVSSSCDSPVPPNPEVKPSMFPMLPQFPLLSILPPSKPAVTEVTSEIQRLREAAFGRYKNVLCVICNEWICSRNRKNHIEAHLNYRPYKCSACSYARRREIFVIQHIKTQHKDEKAEMLSSVDLHVAMEVDRLADECVTRTRKLIDSMQEKKDGDFGENKDFDEKALELMMAEEAEKKVVVIESVSEVRPKVANYHRRQRTKVLKKIYDTDVAKQAELKIVKDEENSSVPSIKMDEGFEINIDDLMKMVEAAGENQESEAGPSEPKKTPIQP